MTPVSLSPMLGVADPATLRLGRVEDDLIVGADGVRRRVRLAPVLRRRILIFDHWSALIEEKSTAQRYVVDSWFRDNGQPAVIMSLGNWMNWKDVRDDE